MFTVPAGHPDHSDEDEELPDYVDDEPLADIELLHYGEDDDDLQLDPVEVVGDEAKAEEGRLEEQAAREVAERERLDIEELLAEMRATAAREEARLQGQPSDLPPHGPRPGFIYHTVLPPEPDTGVNEHPFLPDGSEEPGEGTIELPQPPQGMDIDHLIRQRREKRPRAGQYAGSYKGMDKPGRKKPRPSPAEDEPMPQPAPEPVADERMEPVMEDIERIVRERRAKRPREAQYQGTYAGMNVPGKKPRKGAKPATKRKAQEQPVAVPTIELAAEAVQPRRSKRLKKTPKVKYKETRNRKPKRK